MCTALMDKLGIKDNKDLVFLETKFPAPVKTSSRTSILSRRSSGRVTPEDAALASVTDLQTASPSLLSLTDSGADLSPARKGGSQ